MQYFIVYFSVGVCIHSVCIHRFCYYSDIVETTESRLRSCCELITDDELDRGVTRLAASLICCFFNKTQVDTIINL